MSRYKICRFVNGNGKEWYQIQKKGWLFWSYLSEYEWFGSPEVPPIKRTLKFESVDKTKKYINMLQDTERYVKNNKMTKKVECFYYD